MQLSIVIPFYNEEESLPELISWIQRVVDTHRFSYEIIMVDDGSNDNSWEVVKKLQTQNEHIKGISFQRNYGKSAALNEAFKAALGDYIITMDADLQDSPDEIPELYEMITTGRYDIVSGWKKKRFDNALTKNIPSKLYNYVTGKLSGIQLHDMNCGLKIYRSKVIKSVEVYGEMHRYIPVLAKWAGFKKIGEKPVAHQARKYGVSKFGWERFVNGFLDLASIMFVGKYGKKPMHIFGFWGILVFMVGAGIWIYLAIAKFAFMQYKMTERPLFYVGIISIVIGTQLFLAGFLGELISRNSSDRNSYNIAEKIGLDE
ncbi:MAG TPA: glycosyltransferase family 2 protein [Chitinophagaceae bacterium]|nr:glycosyltransferase family 2 protein [Bacteroidota bacterium]MBK7589142.1 glycosyltransferase family 2 protein [Bacteroidota bacterium]MBK9301438.1 glycosyltransferase family 2 protein [Bacteroidota bacterium]MBK9483273.1 glycosyltransferase family 2 protein [Bacteroidota bacterium]HMT36744.1 glycosyltransferase family 2 protein [Chitinophagaceae bacterium]